MTSQPVLTSPMIGQTENALRAVLMRTLNGTELDYYRWVALKVVSDSREPLSAYDLVARLKGALKIDDATATESIDYLKAHDILDHAGDVLTPTESGTALYRRLSDQIRENAQKIYAGLAADDLAVAYRVLSTITDQANALLAS